jgi:alkylation response protein AidB-like acyl-CoA dehydrogenase
MSIAGLHLPEEHGGSGYGLPELVVVVEELGRAIAPGPFVPTVIASAVVAAAAPTRCGPGCSPAWPTARCSPGSRSSRT